MRLDEARSLDIGGSGLGLAIVRSIMSALGGSIVAVAVETRCRVQGLVPRSERADPVIMNFGALALVLAAGLVGPLLRLGIALVLR